MSEKESARIHDFESAPNRTLVRLAVPVLLSLIAEPVTGLVDTAFVARLSSDALAGLGVGAIALSAVFWIFNFLGIGTQTEVARSDGSVDAGGADRPGAWASLALRLALLIGLAAAVAGYFLTVPMARALGAADGIEQAAVAYMHIRWLGAPAVLVMVAGFGALRGLQDMKRPLAIAVGVNVANVALDALLIPGAGPVPALGVAGAAWASTASQWGGAAVCAVVVARRMDLRGHSGLEGAGRLMRIGGDLFVRTGMLTLFLLLATRSATRIGAEAGAAHQAIRQVWIFTALFLDAWAVSAQSLVGFFMGSRRADQARRVASLSCAWSIGTGFFLAAALAVASPLVVRAVVPAGAEMVFYGAWWIALLSLPASGVTFATDGIHWGTGDFAYLRTATSVATLISGGILIAWEAAMGIGLPGIWWLTTLWVVIRAVFGWVRIWPGLGQAPLAVRP